MSASAETRPGLPGAAAAERGAGPAFDRAAIAGLVWTLVRTDFKTRYHGTVGGFVWALLKPLAMFAMLLGVFSFIFPDPAYKLNLIVGLFLWEFFSDGTKTGLMSLASRGFLLTRARCPSWVLVVTSISNALVTLVVFVVIMVAFLSWFGTSPSPAAVLLFFMYALALVAIVLGFSLAASVLFLRYRDLNQVWDVVTQAGFFLAPIIYPLGILPERYHVYLYLWAPTPAIEFARDVLVRGTVPSVTGHVYLAGAAVLSLVVGALIHRRLAPRAAEYL